MGAFDIRVFGAKGDGAANDTTAIQNAIDEAAKSGGSVVFPPGVYMSGTVYLKDNICIQLDAGSVWKGYPDLSLYPDIPPAIGSRMDTTPWKAFIYAAHKENITIRGEGTIHPNGSADCFQNGKGNSPERPYGLHIIGCRNVTVRDITLRDSAFWMQRYFACDGLRLSGVTVYNHCNVNNDGVDIDSCKNVVVSDCRIDASDDALCFKSEGADITENVSVSNCILSSFASAFKLGTASIGGFRNVVATNCVIRPSVATNMTHPCAAWGGLMGIDLGNVDGGILENVLVSGFVVEGVETPIYIKLGDRNSRSDRGPVWPDAPEISPGTTRGIRIDNVIARGAGPIASAIVGYPGNPIEDVRLSRIDIVAAKATQQKPDFDIEIHSNRYPFNRIFNSDLPSFGLYARHVKGLVLDTIRMEAASGDRRPACTLDDVVGVTIRGFQAPSSSGAPIVCRGCADVCSEDVPTETVA